MKIQIHHILHCTLIYISVAIPLVGPDVKLLPIHFWSDPGANVDWSKNVAEDIPVPQEDRINKLQLYLDLEKLPMLNYDCDNDSEGDRKSTGSCESDDNSGCIGKEKKKDGKMSQQLQTMSKQFGSLGKSMGKKIRKNFGSVGKALKNMSTDTDKGRRISIGSGITQSTKLPLTIVAVAEQEHVFIWCAKVCMKQVTVMGRMIENYLQDARKRFEQGNQLMLARGEEIRRRSVGRFADDDNGLTTCVNPDCNMYGNPEMCYLCSKCFSQQRQQALNQEHQKVKPLYPGAPTENHIFKPKGPEVVQKCGKSTFYLDAEEGDDDAFEKPTVKQQGHPQGHQVPEGQKGQPIKSQPGQPLKSQPVPGFSSKQQAPVPIKPQIPATVKPVVGGAHYIDANKPQTNVNSIARPRPVSQAVGTTSDHKARIDLHTKNKLTTGTTVTTGKDRTPSPDYDNVDYKSYRKSCPPNLIPKVQNKDANSSMTHPCKTPGCVFFGTEANSFYCSSCFKKLKPNSAVQKTRL